MSTHLNIAKVMACLAVIGLTAASGYPAQAQQQNCNQQTGQNCMNTPKVDPSMQPQGGGAYDKANPTVGSGQTTTANPYNQPAPVNGSGQTTTAKPNSGNSN